MKTDAEPLTDIVNIFNKREISLNTISYKESELKTGNIYLTINQPVSNVLFNNSALEKLHNITSIEIIGGVSVLELPLRTAILFRNYFPEKKINISLDHSCLNMVDNKNLSINFDFVEKKIYASNYVSII